MPGLFTKARSPHADSPVMRLFEATMRGNAEIASDQQSKKVASAQMEAAEKTSVTINQGKTGPTVTVKNADPSLLNGTQEQELRDAADAPFLKVESALSTVSPSGDDPLAPVYDVVDKHLGQRLARPSDPDIEQKLSTPDGIRQLTIEMGGKPQHAEMAIRALRDGRTTPAALRERVQAFRAKKFSAIYDTIQKPLNEAQDIANRAATQTEDARKAQKDRTERLAKVITDTDLSLVPREQWTQTVEGQVGEALSDFERRKVEQKGARDVQRALDAFMNKDADALGQFGTVEEATTAFGRPISEQQRTSLAANWRAARSKIVKAQQQEDRRDEREARMMRAEILRWRADNRAEKTVERLERIEQRQLTAAEKKEHTGKVENLLKEIQKNNEEIVRNVSDFSKLDVDAPPERRKFLRDRNADLKRRNDDIAEQVEALGVKLTKLVDQAEYDALLKAGHTPQQIRDAGIRLRRKK